MADESSKVGSEGTDGGEIAETGASAEPYPVSQRDRDVLALAYEIGKEEVRESVKAFEAIRGRAASLFGAVAASTAFLTGTALREVDLGTVNDLLLAVAIGSLVAFGIASAYALVPGTRSTYLSGKHVRNRYFFHQEKGRDVEPPYLWPAERVRSQLIVELDDLAAENVTKAKDLSFRFTLMLISGGLVILTWALVVGFATSS